MVLQAENTLMWNKTIVQQNLQRTPTLEFMIYLGFYLQNLRLSNTKDNVQKHPQKNEWKIEKQKWDTQNLIILETKAN